MLWYKTWLETRWRFVIGLVVLGCCAAGIVIEYPRMMQLVDQIPTPRMGGEIGRRVQEAVELSREYRGFVWSQGFRQNLAQIGTLFAVLLGTGGLLLHSSGGAALFTLSLPVSRRRLLGVRAAAGLAQWLALAMVPSLLIPLLSPAVGESYGVGPALVHGLCLFVAGTVFFSLALLLSTVFGDVWRPLLLALLIAILLAFPEQLVHELSRFSLFAVMSGEAFFRTGRLPWLGLLASAALSTALLYGAAANLARRDL
jgi:ABC-2 type transport system permease protein